MKIRLGHLRKIIREIVDSTGEPVDSADIEEIKSWMLTQLQMTTYSKASELYQDAIDRFEIDPVDDEDADTTIYRLAQNLFKQSQSKQAARDRPVSRMDTVVNNRFGINR